MKYGQQSFRERLYNKVLENGSIFYRARHYVPEEVREDE